MTTQEMFQSLVNEIESDFARDPYASIDRNAELSAFFWIRKHIAPADRGLVYKDLLDRLLGYLSARRDQVLSLASASPLDERIYREQTKDLHCFQGLLGFLIPKVADVLQEVDLWRFVEFSLDKKEILLRRIHHDSAELIEVNATFLHLSKLLDLLLAYRRLRPLSASLIQRLQAIKADPKSDLFAFQREEIALLLNNEPLPEAKVESPRTLSANLLAADKKWKWLQDHPLGFVSKRTTFYALLVALSQVDYFDPFVIDDAMRRAIDSLDSAGFEVFVLDVHADSCADASKRNPWFIADRAVAYQIFVWLLCELKTPNRYAILTKIAEKCFTKLSGSGATSRLIGDVVLRLLAESQSIEGLGTLLKQKARNKYPVYLDALKTAIVNAERYSGLQAQEVEDFFISDYGLVDGFLQRTFGEYESQIQVGVHGEVSVTWTKAGTALKSEPSALKGKFGNELKVWKSTIQDIKKEISGQKIRLENLWRKEKAWDYPTWEKYFLQHRLVGILVRRLIWQFETEGVIQDGIWVDGRFVDIANQPITNIERSHVTLWHPALAEAGEVLAWRNFMLSREIKQPFKQAYREVYWVTDAEIATSTYSNRFGGHVVRHHKLVALAQQRLWNYTVSDLHSGHNNPSIAFPDQQILCMLDLVNEREFARTGRVHFQHTQLGVALRMENIPKLIFSEAMRDVDLFVGVCSIGTEEQWADQLYLDYWRNFSVSELSELAQTRKSVIASILPKLKLKAHFKIEGNYLIVSGKLRNYKIHFGSSNILMSPNDQYLCIVPDQRKGGNPMLWLPFDGDAILSLILSKALLLVDDDKITDPVILNQLNQS